MGARTTLAKFRNAGFRWSTRALYTRLTRKLQTAKAIRAYLDRRWRVTPETLRNAIDFGKCAPGDIQSRFVSSCPSKHFFSDIKETVAAAKQHFPDSVAKTIAEADAICRHEFGFLGRDVSFGERIDWFWIPDTGARWPRCHVDDFPKSFYDKQDRPGDVKYPWELSRHQYFVTLGKAYRYTGDEKYAREFTAQVLDWIAQNPFREGIHWTSEMELGIRIISWSNAFALFKDSPYFQQNGLELFLVALYQHALYLRQRLTTGWLAANNHLLGETAGLFAFAVLFPHFKASSEFRRTALSIFADALERQIFADGVNREQATGYHRFVVDFIWIIVRLGELNSVAVPPVVYQRLERMLEYESALMPPNGRVPQVGDCDDGRGLPLSESVDFFDYRGWLAAGAVHFNRADLWRSAEGGNEEALWLIGAAGWAKLQSLTPDPAPRTSIHFREGGHCMLRTGDARDDSYVFVRCGEFGLGQDGSSTHSHADILSPVVTLRGEPLIVDSGTYAYLLDTADRDAFRSTAYHNTCAPRDTEQAPMHSLWGWGTVPRARVTQWESRDGVTRFEGELESCNGYTHRRRLLLAHNEHLLTIEDSLTADVRFAHIDAHFHLAEGLTAQVLEASIVRVQRGDRVVAQFVAEGFDSIGIVESRFSPAYGTQSPNQTIRLTVNGCTAKTRVIIS